MFIFAAENRILHGRQRQNLHRTLEKPPLRGLGPADESFIRLRVPAGIHLRAHPREHRPQHAETDLELRQHAHA